MIIEFCSNLNWNTIGAIAAVISAIATVFAAFFAWRVGTAANTIASYETNIKIVQEIYDLFEAAKSNFYGQIFYKNLDAELLITKALNKASLFGYSEIEEQLKSIRQNLLFGHEAYSLQDNQNVNETTKIIMDKKRELDILFDNKTAFQKYFKVNNTVTRQLP